MGCCGRKSTPVKKASNAPVNLSPASLSRTTPASQRRRLDRVSFKNTVDSELEIVVADEREDNPNLGPSAYHILGPDSKGSGQRLLLNLQFQTGAAQEVGITGVTNEALIEIILDRLEGFQKGEFACAENASAMEHLQAALSYLNDRTKDRLNRGVEGSYKP